MVRTGILGPQNSATVVPVAQATSFALEIRVRSENASWDLVQEKGPEPASPYVLLHVSNNGIGFAPQEQERIFRPFRGCTPGTGTRAWVWVYSYVRKLLKDMAAPSEWKAGQAKAQPF